jgi:myo-inositol-1-phosphate synthase
MSIDRKLIREQFLIMREDENKRMKEEEIKKQQLIDEMMRQEDELRLMAKEEDKIKRIMFYKKLGVNKLDMYIEYLFDCHYDEYK